MKRRGAEAASRQACTQVGQ